jgi:prepilin-type N-terminal cleavage/methylation domain-containing protein
MDFKGKKQKGFSMVEILVVIAIITICLSSLLGLTILSLKASSLIKETSQAKALAQESLEEVRNFRDGTIWDTDGLGVLSTNTNYYSQISGNPPKWIFVLGTETVDLFNRKIVFEEVLRDANKNIVTSGGDKDSNTRKVTVTVSWKGKEVKIISYFTNWK